ncbi:amino acid adenylation domain-containing protein [Streptomyces sp. NBC_00390]|uniref:non-ribosomal peptide synthetase/type I polyketide synthase n=1 Tax=Streptomyces sp. NBC_00390 TaxID=2975736 RepID=UPI002E2152DB|nr:non-ribosomal peptide synthetase/type I polyketide synthase [Streptomyces sp. NBC_00390]
MRGPNGETALLDVLVGAAEEAPDQTIVHVRGDGSEQVVTHRELRDESMRVAGGFIAAGLAPGSPVVLLADRSDEFQPLFWGAVAAGLIPVPLAPDARRVLPVWELLDQPPVAVDEACAPLLPALPDTVRPLRLAELRESAAPGALPVPAPGDVAFLQFSSGSTGSPKGVELTHAAVLANLEQIRVAAAIRPDDVVASWMPYFHDMGLIGTHLVPLAARLKQVKLGPLSFAKRPALWLESAARHRATLLSAANFALALVERRLTEDALSRIDLTSVRTILVGAEPISPSVWRAFAGKMRPSGLAADAPQPVYGLAEATLAVAFPPPGEVARPLALDRAALSQGRAEMVAPGPDATELMDVGHPVPGCEVRITDDEGEPLGECRVGHIEVRGPQVARGYHRSPEATAAAFAGGWLRTGDMGFLNEGRLCVTGRFKDVVFVNGRTFHAVDLEEVAAGTPGLTPGPVAVVGSTDPVGGGERVVVFVASGPSRAAAAGDVLDEVAARVGEALGHDDVRVLALPARSFPRTTSGKLRRAVMRERFEAGAYGQAGVHRAAGATRTAGTGQAIDATAGAGKPIGASMPRSRTDIESAVRSIWARVLDLPATAIGPHDAFLSVGGSSLKAMEVLAALEDTFGLTLRPSDVRDHSTVAALAGHVLASLGVAHAHIDAPQEAGEAPGRPAVAITAMACRFPGADTPEAFWARLADGHDAVTGVPAGRWSTAAETEDRWGAFLDDPAGFDAGYFGIGDEEARATDPQARLFLELAHEALERAGYAGPRRRGRRVGVFAAAGDSGYRKLLEQAYGEAELSASALTGNLPNLLAARVAHCLDLTGPALAVDTACSSALVALHLAHRSLQQGECDIAVVGGVHLNLTPTGYALLEKSQALSPTGRCHAFGSAADGFVPGEGGAAIVLMRLDDAAKADDPVLAVLRGTAVNNDGRSLSLMAPNPLTQREVITQAYREAGIDPGSVSYVEAHGTGTPIGDRVEMRSLAHAFRPRADGRPRLLGSVKTNLGHLLNAAAMPSLVKVVLALGHRQLPPSLHHTPPAANLDLDGSGFAVVGELCDWEAPGPLTAGINAFGFGGTNAHAVLEEPPARPLPASPPSEGVRLLTLSARSADGLRAAAADLARHLREHPELDEGGVCAAVAAARDEGAHRLAVVADGDLAARLEARPPGTEMRSRPRLVFLLPGQGAQRPGQARALYSQAPAFREVLDEASALVGEVDGRSLAAWCLDPDTPPAALARTDLAQPILVAYGVALARQLKAWGITPDAVAGHSVGEIAAACVAGTLTLADALRFAAERGRLMAELCAPGAMAAVHGGEETVAALVAGSRGALGVAAVNSTRQVVISGTAEAVDRAVDELTALGVAVRRLDVSRAFHSPLMGPALGPLADAAATLRLHPPVTPLMSTVTTEWQPALDPEYLRQHARRPVRFGAAVERLLDDGYDTFVELGPAATLGGAVRAVVAAHARGSDAVALTAGNGDGARGLLKTAGRLWQRGVRLDRTALDAGHARVAVPTYAFQRRRFWPEPAPRPLLHRFVWDDAPLTVGTGPRTVMLAGPDSSLSRALTDRLTGRGVTVYRSGALLPEGAPRPDVAVLLAGPAPDPDSVAAFDAVQHSLVTGLLDLLPLLARDRPRVLVVTEDVHATGVVPERLRPAQAVLTGLTLALPEELSGTVAHSVDLSSLDDVATRLNALDHELGARAGTQPDAVAWRADRRLGRTVKAVATSTSASASASAELPADGVYLITGGAGGMGGALARDLADRGRPTLVLTGRSPMPPAGLLSELRALGAVAEYRVADVSTEAGVEALMADLPRLDGLFHAAGVVRPGTLRSKSPKEVTQVLAAKTRGTLLLARGLRRHGLRPSVCVAFSSVASVLPGLAGALGDYAAGNAYLDAFAAAERAAGRPWQALNFAAFAETGLAARAEVPAGCAGRGPAPLGTGAALEALRLACGLDAAQLLVADPDSGSAPRPSATARTVPVPAPAPAAATAANASGAAARPSAPTPSPTAGAAGRTTGEADGVTAVLRRLLAVSLQRAADDLGVDEPFLAMGLDSLTAVDLVKRLEKELDRSLPITLFFEHRTLGELAAHLHAEEPHTGQVLRHHQEAPADSPFPLTPVQLAFVTQGRLQPDITPYGYVRQTISGPLDAELLGQALGRLVDRHPMLRIRFHPGSDAGRPEQAAVAPGQGPVPAWYEVRDLPGVRADDEELEALEEALCNRPFDLAAEAPVRAVLARTTTGPAHLVLVVHHAAADGFSLNIVGEELWTVYTALSEGRTPDLAPLGTSFSAYAAHLRAERSDAAFAEDQAYWRAALADIDEPLQLPYDGDPRGVPAPPLLAHQAATDPELSDALRNVAAAHGVSLFHLLLAAYARCLSRWSGRRDVAVNVARARRETRLPGIDRLVGPLADTLPLFASVDPDEPVHALAVRLRDAWLSNERHARLTSLDLARLLPSGGAGPRTVSPASFSLSRFPVSVDPHCPVEVRPTAAGTASAATRLSLLCWESDGTLRFSWNFPARLFDRTTVDRLAREHLAELTELASSTVPQARTETQADPQAQARSGIVARLCAQFRATPDAVAVDTGEATITYAELDRASAALAAGLRASGVTGGDLVGLLTEPGADTVAGVVGILRAGAGWVPLDATHPPARLADQLARSGARTLVCHAATRAQAAALAEAAPVSLVLVDDPSPAPCHVDAEAATVPGSLAYVIFTSGSTGRPKAVPITHRSMANYLDWALATFGYHRGDRLAQTASVCFDASVRQLLAPLLVGATVVTVPWHLVRDPEALLDRVEKARISVWSSVPTLWSRLLEAAETRVREGAPLPDLSALRWIHVGGEALSAAHVRRWYDLFGPGHRIANLYGPTEATINATCHLVEGRPADDVRTLPIGRPLTGTEVEVVAADGRRCAPGESGELLISGTGLTPGYLGEPELTAAAFTERGGRRWYRSGDRVRSRPDGVLEFLGRLDDQVKIRGYRVEPGEIEAVLETHPAVVRAAVVHRDDRLIAFVECRLGDPAPEPTALRAHLTRTLPGYMLPSRIHTVDALPLTGTGKIDRSGLAVPAPRSPSADTPGPASCAAQGDVRRTPPVTPTEILLARIWSELLDVPRISREDDFFSLGGDSLLVLQVFARLRDEIPVLPRPTVIYEHGTLAALAAAVDSTPADDESRVVGPESTVGPVHADSAVPTPFPLTPSQRGFLLAETISPDAASAWLACLRVHGPLRPDLFQRAVDSCVVRHPMLRTVFPAGARPPVQQELPPSLRLPVDFETVTDPGLVPLRIAEERERRLEPWAWPLLRLRLLTLAPDEHLLVVHAHHLIGDGYSVALLGRELLAAYDRLVRGESAELPLPRSTFRDHVALLERPVAAPGGPETEARQARLNAPYHRPALGRGVESAKAGGDLVPPPYRSTGFTLDTGRVAALRRVAAEAGTTLFAPLLTAYHRTLAEFTGQDDLILGLAVTGRDHALPDAHLVFGPFATAVPLRPGALPGAEVSGRSFADDLRRIAAEAADARTHGGEATRAEGGLPPAVQFLFTFLDFSALGPLSGDTLSLTWDDSDPELAPPPVGTDTFLAVRPVGAEGLRVVLRASAAGFTEAAFERFTRALRDQLAEAADAMPPVGTAATAGTVDAALVGYLPAPAYLASLAGPLTGASLEPSREQLRDLLFPDGRPRLVEVISTPLGRSGFVCLPLFADELPATPDLAGRTARAVEYAASLGARCVSLAGMIPALTGYGFGVLRETDTQAAVTTGHAATTVSVVKTVHAALEASGRELDELAVAVVGLGSIGRSSLELLLTLAQRPPARLVLCDVAGSEPRLKELAEGLLDRGLATAVEVHESDPALPAVVYEAGLVVTAVSGGDSVLDVERLRPGAIVVDDSFPHCFDTAKALGRMRERRDVLIVGGGLLAIGDAERRIAEGLPPAAAAGYAAQSWLPGTIASCRLESLLRAARPGLPLVHGLVDGPLALAHWREMEAAGVEAGPLHLFGHAVAMDRPPADPHLRN